MESCILHVDMDAFYASVEQRDNPQHKGQPVLVGGTGPRGVVAACSYEARKFGIHSAMPMAEAIRRCPQAICVHPRMSHYKDVSRQIFSVFAEFTPEIEGLSLDEAYLDVTASISLFGTPRELAKNIKMRIREATGLTASVGVAPNKFLAKLASDHLLASSHQNFLDDSTDGRSEVDLGFHGFQQSQRLPGGYDIPGCDLE